MDQVQKVQLGKYSFPCKYWPVFERRQTHLGRRYSRATSYRAALKLTARWIEKQGPEAGHKHIDVGCGHGCRR